MKRPNREWRVLTPLFDDVPILMVLDSNDDLHAYSSQRLEVTTGQEMTWPILSCMIMQMDWELDYHLGVGNDASSE
jgi:hypothetical protein